MTFWTILGDREILCSFRLVQEGKTIKEIPESSRLDFWEKFSAKTSGLLNRGGKAHLILLRTLLAICQKSCKPSLWEVMDSFVLVAYASLTASRTLLQQLLVCLNCTSDSEDFFKWCKLKSDFYKLWQQHKLLKTMVMSEVWPDTYNEGYAHQFQPEPIHKIHYQQQKHWI